MKFASVFALFVSLLVFSGRADLITTISNSGGTVSFSTTGTLDVTDTNFFTFDYNYSTGGQVIFNSPAQSWAVAGSVDAYDIGDPTTTFPSVGSGTLAPTMTGSGGVGVFDGAVFGEIYVPAGHTNGSISSVISTTDSDVVNWYNSVAGQSWSATLPDGQKMTWQATAVPEPSAAFLSLFPALALIWSRRRSPGIPVG